MVTGFSSLMIETYGGSRIELISQFTRTGRNMVLSMLDLFFFSHILLTTSLLHSICKKRSNIYITSYFTINIVQVGGLTSSLRRIEHTLMRVDGVTKAVVALSTNTAHIEFDPNVLGPRDVIKIIEVLTLAAHSLHADLNITLLT